MSIVRVEVMRGLGKHLRAGHPWVFRKGLEKPPRLPAGSVVDLTETDSFRLLHGEGDGVPGVVVDLYAGFAVLKLYSAGLTPYRPLIVEALRAAVPELRTVLGRD